MKKKPGSMDKMLRAGVEAYVEALGRAQDSIAIAGEGAQALRAQSARCVARHPLLCVAAGLAAGVLLGTLFNRGLKSRRKDRF